MCIESGLQTCPLSFVSVFSVVTFYVPNRAGLNPQDWHLHCFRDTAATRWLRASIDVRTVQSWLC